MDHSWLNNIKIFKIIFTHLGIMAFFTVNWFQASVKFHQLHCHIVETRGIQIKVVLSQMFYDCALGNLSFTNFISTTTGKSQKRFAEQTPWLFNIANGKKILSKFNYYLTNLFSQTLKLISEYFLSTCVTWVFVITEGFFPPTPSLMFTWSNLEVALISSLEEIFLIIIPHSLEQTNCS